jgi:hypothetical protein
MFRLHQELIKVYKLVFIKSFVIYLNILNLLIISRLRVFLAVCSQVKKYFELKMDLNSIENICSATKTIYKLLNTKPKVYFLPFIDGLKCLSEYVNYFLPNRFSFSCF